MREAFRLCAVAVMLLHTRDAARSAGSANLVHGGSDHSTRHLKRVGHFGFSLGPTQLLVQIRLAFQELSSEAWAESGRAAAATPRRSLIQSRYEGQLGHGPGVGAFSSGIFWAIKLDPFGHCAPQCRRCTVCRRCVIEDRREYALNLLVDLLTIGACTLAHTTELP